MDSSQISNKSDKPHLFINALVGTTQKLLKNNKNKPINELINVNPQFYATIMQLHWSTTSIPTNPTKSLTLVSYRIYTYHQCHHIQITLINLPPESLGLSKLI